MQYAYYDTSCRTFCQLSIGGPVAGLVFAVVTTLWLRLMYNNEMGEIILTIVAAFGTYLVSDQLLHVSGVLAVVVLGATPALLLCQKSIL
jgi:NhaP-type Na+/H+ or K+/H+ antiporter